MRKQIFLNVLTWLQIHNPLYQNIVINHDSLLFILNEFISKGILLRVIVIENNSIKCKGYEANLAENNEKNNLYYTIRFVGINKSRILSSYIYINVNESKQNLYLK